MSSYPSDNDHPPLLDYTMHAELSTLYMPIVSPPTPAPSPRPSFSSFPTLNPAPLVADPAASIHAARREFSSLSALGVSARQKFLAAILADCSPSELLFISTRIAPLLQRDFLRDLPPELALHVLSF